MKTAKELEYLSNYVQGWADANDNNTLTEASRQLRIMANATCPQGILGCYNKSCTSDHK